MILREILESLELKIVMHTGDRTYSAPFVSSAYEALDLIGEYADIEACRYGDAIMVKVEHPNGMSHWEEEFKII